MSGALNFEAIHAYFESATEWMKLQAKPRAYMASYDMKGTDGTWQCAWKLDPKFAVPAKELETMSLCLPGLQCMAHNIDLLGIMLALPREAGHCAFDHGNSWHVESSLPFMTVRVTMSAISMVRCVFAVFFGVSFNLFSGVTSTSLGGLPRPKGMLGRQRLCTAHRRASAGVQ